LGRVRASLVSDITSCLRGASGVALRGSEALDSRGSGGFWVV